MDYEQKYKEALERARGMMSYKEVRREDMEYLFPELKESEDERIRKQIISFLKEFEYDHYRSLNFSSWIAWLENQGEHKSIWHNEDEEPQKGSLILLIMQSGTPVVAKIIESNHTFNHGERWAYIDDLLEKQGEQKPVDKVEPKFNLYDWVVTDKGDTVQIGAVNNGYYTLCNGMDFNMSYVDKCWHKWTIEDAKDGDVLVCDNSKCIVIFKNIRNEEFFNSHGFIGCCSGRFEPRQGYHSIKDAHPVTKEQRDLLLTKMEEADYTWSKKRKKLIKM